MDSYAESKARILIVEDDSIVASDIRRRLEDLGFSVPAIAPTGEAAIKKVKENHPDLYKNRPGNGP